MIRIHPAAELSIRATVGDGSQIWHQAQVREDVDIGRNCILGKGVYVNFGVRERRQPLVGSTDAIRVMTVADVIEERVLAGL